MDSLSKKEEQRMKADFGLHVALIMKIEGCSKSVATFKAWLAGPAGLVVLLKEKVK